MVATLEKIVLHIPLLFGLLLVFFIVACATTPLYFFSRRPKRGTTEWIDRLNPVYFSQVPHFSFRPADVIWTVLSAFIGAFLGALYCFVQYRLFQRTGTWLILKGMAFIFLRRSAISAAFSAILYLLSVAMFGRRFPAICIAALGGLMLFSAALATTFLAASLLFLYLWMRLPAKAHFLLRALWLLLSGVSYAVALVASPGVFWLAPVYLASFVVTLYFRFREDDLALRSKRLLISLLAAVGCAVFSVIALLLVYGLLKGYLMYYGPKLLLMGDFYRLEVLPNIRENISAVFSVNRNLLDRVAVGDAVAALLGLASAVPVLYGTCKLRDSRCLLLSALLLFGSLALFIGGYYFLLPIMLLVAGWSWGTFTSRDSSSYVGIAAALTLVVFFASNLIR